MCTRKNFVAFLLALLLTMASGVTAFAARGSSSIVINYVASESHTFTAYQIFSGELSGDEQSGYELTKVVWGDGVTSGDAALVAAQAVTGDNGVTYPFKDCSSAAEVAAVLDDYEDDTAVVKAFAEAMEAVKGTVSGLTSAGTSDGRGTYTYTISGVAAGYYLVTDSTTASTSDAVSAYILYVAGNTAHIRFKNEVPTTTKIIVDSAYGNDYGTSADANGTVTFEITGTVPGADTMSNYDTYTYIFHDTLSANLEYADSLTVSASTSGTLAEGTNSDYTVGTEAQNGQTLLTITILNAKDLAGQTITVRYQAKLKASASAGTAETNKVYIEYSNDPNGDGTGKTAEPKVYVYTFRIVANKVDEKKEALEGAGFTLYKAVKANITAFEDGETYYTLADGSLTKVASGSAYDSGSTYYIYSQVGSEVTRVTTFTFEDLGEGYYKLAETTVPQGYKQAGDIEFQITATYGEDGQISALTETSGYFTVNEGTLTTTIMNVAGATLPSSGGMGTTIFYIVGGILVAAALLLLIVRKCRRDSLARKNR
ncbi:MAG: isopeptide-forming domain-containing fimbrial protein [Lachnospiraceae bacterium]|nr:isopeptide-forming domain-containing fimbrial protein [Lachnospiraceae bacterium]